MAQCMAIISEWSLDDFGWQLRDTPPLGSTVQQPEHAPAGSRSALLILRWKISARFLCGQDWSARNMSENGVSYYKSFYIPFSSLSLPFVCPLQSALGPRSFFFKISQKTCLRVTAEAMPVYTAITIPQHGLLSCASVSSVQKYDDSLPAPVAETFKLGSTGSVPKKGEISHFTAIQIIQFHSENDVLKHGTIPGGYLWERGDLQQDQGGAFVHLWNRSWGAARLRLGPWIPWIPWIHKIRQVLSWTDYDGSTNGSTNGFSGFRSGTEDGESRKVLEAAVWLSGGPSISGRDHTSWPLNDTENMGRYGRRWKMMIF